MSQAPLHSTPRTLLLASTSPSRRAILESAGIRPRLAASHVDEEAIRDRLGSASPTEVVCALARAKAQAVERGDADVVIGADSMLLLDGELQGKPHTVEETIKRWHNQAGARAELITGHCLIGPADTDATYVDATATTVVFADASAADIAAYAESGEPLQCAGAFTLEALGGWFIDRIEGDPSSVIGLSLPLVRRALYSFGFDVSEFWSRP